MEREYFKKWPEEDVLGIVQPEDDRSGEGLQAMSMEDAKRLGEATKARKKARLQLASWFNNQSQKPKKNQDSVAPSKAGSLAARLFKHLVKKRRRLQKVEIFQKRNKDLIDAAVKAEMAKWRKKSRKASSSDDDSSSSSDDDSSTVAVTTTAAAAATTTAAATVPDASRSLPRWIAKLVPPPC
ncbi:hypothetical protein B0H12DRAFT_1083109, partial [Mycena haematopus]